MHGVLQHATQSTGHRRHAEHGAIQAHVFGGPTLARLAHRLRIQHQALEHQRVTRLIGPVDVPSHNRADKVVARHQQRRPFAIALRHRRQPGRVARRWNAQQRAAQFPTLRCPGQLQRRSTGLNNRPDRADPGLCGQSPGRQRQFCDQRLRQRQWQRKASGLAHQRQRIADVGAVATARLGDRRPGQAGISQRIPGIAIEFALFSHCITFVGAEVTEQPCRRVDQYFAHFTHDLSVLS